MDGTIKAYQITKELELKFKKNGYNLILDGLKLGNWVVIDKESETIYTISNENFQKMFRRWKDEKKNKDKK